MKYLILLSLFSITCFSFANAQKKQKPVTAYAITGTEKGSTNWSEVRLIDINTGQEVQTVYKTAQEIPLLNARTGKPIVKMESNNNQTSTAPVQFKADGVDVENIDGKTIITIRKNGNQGTQTTTTFIRAAPVAMDKPFSTLSAACAYDERHDRLYYTPMGINELRYIDLKAKSPSIKYFEGESFGAVANRRDVPNHITRMVIASDGNGYALTNNGEHLIKFTTNRKAITTDLGSLVDDVANAENSIHSQGSYGGDMIADDQKNLYVITAYRKVFKVSTETMVATYLGNIQGLPRGYTTNGAAVEEGMDVIVTSSQSTAGYFRVNMKTLLAEAIPNQGSVFNASDLANANLLSEKKGNEPAGEIMPLIAKPIDEVIKSNNIAVFPNPAISGSTVKLTFTNQKEGRYTIQLIDMSGKIISSRQVTVTNKMQIESYEIPESSAKGNYLIKVVSGSDKLVSVNKIIVQ